jgi:hypothetical protein
MRFKHVVTENPVRNGSAKFSMFCEMGSFPMNPILVALVAPSFRRRLTLQAENLGLRHQLAVPQASAPRRLRISR